MSKSSKRRARRERQPELSALGSHLAPIACNPSELEGVGGTAASIREDIALAKAMLIGGWDSPPDKILKLLARIAEAANPAIGLKLALEAILCVNRVYRSKYQIESDRARSQELENLAERIEKALSDRLPAQG